MAENVQNIIQIVPECSTSYVLVMINIAFF